MSASLGSCEVARQLEAADAGAPTVTISGGVSFGAVEVCRIKG
jgi:hypothetical protein